MDENRSLNDAVYVGSDHAGFELKKYVVNMLKEKGVKVVDEGPSEYDKDDDYPDYAEKVCRKISGSSGRGILICGTGQGMERTANKFPGVYASVCWDEFTARVAKEHGNINVLCLGGRITKDTDAKKIVDIWLNEPFSGDERHRRRIDKITRIEKRYMKTE